jgi:hypothetical protein
MAPLQFRIGHQRQVNQVLDLPPFEILPKGFVFGLYLLPSRVCRDIDVEQPQAGQCAVHCLGIFGLHDMEQDLQVVDSRLVDFRHSALQQLHNQLLCISEVTAQKLALRAFQTQAEHQVVMARPVPFIEQRHPGREIHTCRRIGGRCLRLSRCTQIDRSRLHFLVLVDEQCQSPVKLVATSNTCSASSFVVMPSSSTRPSAK